MQCRPGQRLEPIEYRGSRATKVQGHPLAFNQSLGARNIMGGSSMVKRFNREAMVFIPYAGTDVQFGHILHLISWRRGACLMQSLSQQIRQAMVIAVPPPLLVLGDGERVGV